MNHVCYIVQQEDNGKRLGDVIEKRMMISNRMLRRCKNDAQGILVNGIRRTVRYKVSTGDEIALATSPMSQSSDIIRENGVLEIVYEDESVLVVDKPPYMTMFPRRRGELGSLAGLVLSHLDQTIENAVYHPVSRLDIGTSGLVLIAKNAYITRSLSEGRTEKSYQCLAYGAVDTEMHLTGQICEATETLRHTAGPLFYVGHGGKNCETFVTPLFYDDQQHISGLWVKLGSGRRHQIRVHLAHQGHPLLGDTTYGGPAVTAARPLLHAASLTYHHPVDGRIMHHFLPMHRYEREPNFVENELFLIDLYRK